MKIITLNQFAPYIDDFSFISKDGVKDIIVVCNPMESICVSPMFLRSKKTLQEHIEYINVNNIKKALIVAEDISFLRKCPCLEYLYVIPSLIAKEFDFSPLYDLPKIKWLYCETMYGDEKKQIAYVDYSKIQGLQCLFIYGKYGHQQLSKVKGLKKLFFSEGQPAKTSLEGVFDGNDLEELDICQSSLHSLKGLNVASSLRKLGLSYNRKLEDISDLSEVKNTIISLEIENCGKIKDFSVLNELCNLEKLRLVGSNKLPDLNFIHNMPKLKSFIFMMNSENGDLSMCERIPYVAIKNRKHYTHKDKDFSKVYTG